MTAGRIGSDEGLSRSLTDSALLVLGSVLAAVLGFIGLRFLLTGLSEQDYGRYTLFQTAGGLFLVLLLWPVPAVLRLGAEEYLERRSLGRTAASVATLMAGGLLCCLVLLFWLAPRLDAWVEWEATGYVLAFVVVSALAGFGAELLKPAGQVRLRTLIPALTRALFAGLLGLLVLREGGLDVSQAALLSVVATLPALVIPLVALRGRLGSLRPSSKAVRRSARFGAPLLLRNLGLFGLVSVDVIVLRAYMNLESVGRYEVAYRIAEQVVVFGFVLEHLLDPLLSDLAARGEGQALATYQQRVMPQLAWVWGLGAALLIPLAEPMLIGLGAKSAAASAQILQLVLVAVALRGVTTLENPLFSAHLLSFWPTVFFFAALLLNLCGDVVLLEAGWGLVGPALATVAAFALQGVLRSLYLARRLGGGSWRCYLATLPALGLLGLAHVGAHWALGLLAWALASAAVLFVGRRSGLFPAETADVLDSIKMPARLREQLRRFYAGSAPAGPAVAGSGPVRLRPTSARPALVVPAPDPARRQLLLLITELHPAGAERIVLELATRLDPARWQVLVCSLRSPGGDDGAIAHELRRRGLPVCPLRLRGKLDLVGAWRLRQVLARFQPHLIHAHLFHANLAARLLGQAHGRRPVVSTMHVVERRRLPIRFMLERSTASRDALTVCVSQAVARFSRRKLGVRASRLRVVPNGISLSRFQDLPTREEARASLGLAVEKPVIGAVGRLDRQKGLVYLIQAFARLDHPTAQLVIAGSGGEEPALRLLVQQHRLEERVRFLGFRSDVPRVLAALDVFCMPSLWEGFGLSLVEAMAAGVPAVASRIDSLPEVLGEAGVLVSPADPNALAQALGALLADPGRRLELAELGRARAQTFSMESMLDGYLRVYSELLGD